MSGILICAVPQDRVDSVSMASLIFITKLNLIESISVTDGKLHPDNAGDIEIKGVGLMGTIKEDRDKFDTGEVAFFSLILPVKINQSNYNRKQTTCKS